MFLCNILVFYVLFCKIVRKIFARNLFLCYLCCKIYVYYKSH